MTKTVKNNNFPFGIIEPYEELLRDPSEYTPTDQLVYKVMKTEDLLASVNESYLFFNRVDNYNDFPKADKFDGEQLPKDKDANEKIKFQSNPNFSLKNYYDQSRSRTYAFCTSLNKQYIWHNYHNNSKNGKICIVFHLDKLRIMLNEIHKSSTLIYGNRIECHQIFSINYGKIKYVDHKIHRANQDKFPNPIIYTYLKDKEFKNEEEFRISLSATGMGKFVLESKDPIHFGESIKFSFNFLQASNVGVIQEILFDESKTKEFLQNGLKSKKLNLKQWCAR